MSKARRIADVERTATMLDLLRCKYQPDLDGQFAYVVMEEVAPGTGFSHPNRWADVLVLGVWPSKGLMLDGFEIKASKADLKKELADPTKHQALARYCDSWTLLAWDETTLVDGLPDSWGIMVTTEGAHGRELKTIRKAPKLTPDPWPRSFICSLVRNAHQQSPGAAYVARAVIEARHLSFEQGKRVSNADVAHALEPLRRLLFGDSSFRWPNEARDINATIAVAVQRLSQGVLV